MTARFQLRTIFVGTHQRKMIGWAQYLERLPNATTQFSHNEGAEIAQASINAKNYRKNLRASFKKYSW